MPLNTGHRLTTARMTLSDITEADFVATYAADRDPLVARYVGDGLPESRSFDEYCNHFRARISSWMSEHYRLWVMRLHGQDALIGWVMLRPVNDSPHVEVGYRLPQSSWGNGYATEATRAVLAYGFSSVGLDEITAVTHADNAASQHVLIKAGFKRDGTFNYNGRGEIPFFRLSKHDFVNTHGN
jgi:[ribosomal protein S5]-alanine N-acetyltransferase